MSYYADRRERDRGSSDRDRPNPCRLYIGKLSRYAQEQDVRDLFKRFGRIKDILYRDFYAFVEYEDVRDAKDACKELDGYNLKGYRLLVQVANRARYYRRDDYHYDNRNSYDSSRRTDKCNNCSETGHTTSECKSSRRSGREEDKCRECGETGHRSRDCPKQSNGSSSRKRARSPRRSVSPRRNRHSDESRGSPRRRRSPSPHDTKRRRSLTPMEM